MTLMGNLHAGGQSSLGNFNLLYRFIRWSKQESVYDMPEPNIFFRSFDSWWNHDIIATCSLWLVCLLWLVCSYG